MPRADASLVKVLMRDRGGDTESVWCTVVDASRGVYRLASIPFLRERPTFGDAIVATPSRDDVLTFRRVHARGEFVAEMLEYAKKATYAPLSRWLEREHGAIAEGCIGPHGGEPGLVVVAIPRRAGAAKVVAAACAKFPGVWTPGNRPPKATPKAGDADLRLHDAIANGDAAAAKQAIASGAKLERRVGPADDTALTAAAGSRHARAMAVVRVLLAAGAKVNARNTFERSAAFLAAWRGDVKMLDVLARAGADLVARDEGGATTLHGAATSGFAPLAKKLLAAGVDPNDRKNRFGATPLHGAATRDRPEIARLLLAAGAKPALRDEMGFTPLASAAYYGSTATARLLAPLATPADKQEALLHAASEGYLPIVKLLVAAGADPTQRSQRGNTALALARKRKQRAVVDYLTKLSARRRP